MVFEDFLELLEAELLALHINEGMLPYYMDWCEDWFYLDCYKMGMNPRETAELLRERQPSYFEWPLVVVH